VASQAGRRLIYLGYKMNRNFYFAALDVINAERKRHLAQIACDIQLMDELMDSELIYIHSNGHVDSKESYIDSMKSGRVKYRSMRFSKETVRIFGFIGILNGVANFDVTVGNVESSVQLAFHSIWNGASGELKFTSWQATHVA
jgi:hypothetical protein